MRCFRSSSFFWRHRDQKRHSTGAGNISAKTSIIHKIDNFVRFESDNRPDKNLKYCLLYFGRPEEFDNTWDRLVANIVLSSLCLGGCESLPIELNFLFDAR